MDPAAAKQQIAERVKQATRFLVTVNANPTVDQLAACIGLTLLLNKMNKHATAVFSGKVPSTIEFLQPQKTLEASPDSLRDFIISLDKNKADKLRYKVEDDVVRIYITPYRTSLTEKDFIFSEGDFNVEAVIALGVAQRANLDTAITAHGRILHDATVISLNAGQGKAPDLGQINWQDPQASSLSEMLVSISEAFGTGLIDAQIATAFLTGIVAETQRFSNKKTSPKVMTMSAQLMAAGANQQLIVSKLEPPPPPPPKPPTPPPPPPKPPRPPAPPPKPPEPKKPIQPLQPEGVMDVPREENKKGKTDIDLGTTEIHIDEEGNIRTQDTLLHQEMPALKPEVPALNYEAPALNQEVPAAAAYQDPAPAPEPPIPPPPVIPQPLQPAAPPAEPPAKNHAFMGNSAQPGGLNVPFPDTGQPDWAAPYDLVPMDPLRDDSETPQSPGTPTPDAALTSPQGHTVQPPGSTQVTPIGSPVDSARNAVESALAQAPFDPAFSPPVDALHAQPLDEALHVQPAIPSPVKAAGDTPVLALPINGSVPVSAIPPPPFSPPPPAGSQAAPPPMPPPLMAAPGAVIPNLPPK
jgi:hypothetical protein